MKRKRTLFYDLCTIYFELDGKKGEDCSIYNPKRRICDVVKQLIIQMHDYYDI